MTASACFGNQDQGNFVAGVGHELWDNGAICGKLLCIRPTKQYVAQPCTGKIATVKIVDHNTGAAAIITLSTVYTRFRHNG